jgi:hypothetical protein
VFNSKRKTEDSSVSVAARDSELKNRRETASKSRDPKFLEL